MDDDEAGRDRRAARTWLFALPLALALGWSGLGDLALQRPEPARATPSVPATDGLPADLRVGRAYSTSFTVAFPADWPSGNHAVLTATWGSGAYGDPSVCSETVEGVPGRSVTLAGCELSFGQEETGTLTLLVLPSTEPREEDTPQVVTRAWRHRVVPAAEDDPDVVDARRLCGADATGTPPQPLFGPRRAVVPWSASEVVALRCEGLLPKVCVEPAAEDAASPSCLRLPGSASQLRAFPWGSGVVGIAPLGTARLEVSWPDGDPSSVALASDGSRLFGVTGPTSSGDPAAGVPATLHAVDAAGKRLDSCLSSACSASISPS